MTTNQTAPGMGMGAKVGVVLAAVLVIGALVFWRGESPEQAAPQPTPAGLPPRNAEAAPEVMGQRFERAAGEDAPRPQARLEATPRQRQDLGQQRVVGEGLPVSELDIDEDPDDIPTLRRVVLEDPDPERRLAAVTLLGISDDPEAVGVLARALSDEDEDVRMEAILALADFTEEAPVEVLAHALNDPSAEIRYEALDVLSDIETPEAKAVVEGALNDPDEDVRELAEIIVDLWDDEVD